MSRKDKNMDKQGGTNPQNRDLNASQRVSLALKLRATKLTYEQIALQCGYCNASAARKAILRELNRCVVENVDTLRREELMFLDKMHSEIWSLFINPTNKGRLYAADRLLVISDRRCKLMGLDIKPDDASAANIVVIREVPAGLLSEPNA